MFRHVAVGSCCATEVESVFSISEDRFRQVAGLDSGDRHYGSLLLLGSLHPPCGGLWFLGRRRLSSTQHSAGLWVVVSFGSSGCSARDSACTWRLFVYTRYKAHEIRKLAEAF